MRNTLAAADAGAAHFMLDLLRQGRSAVERNPAMRLRSVRFGNVLGSQGSVLPRFAAQTEQAGRSK